MVNCELTQKLSKVWAKTFPDGNSKSLLGHLLDVAAVCLEIQLGSLSRVHREAASLELNPEDLVSLRAWLAGLHDLGKCSVAFQAKSEAHWPEVLLGPYRLLDDPGHWRLTAGLLEHQSFADLVAAALPGVRPGGERILFSAAAGHHGRPPDDLDWGRGSDPHVGPEALQLARDIFKAVTGVVPPPSGRLKIAQAQAMSWQLSGLVTLADWVGSDQEFFGPGHPDDPVAYFDVARETARRALAAKGLVSQSTCRNPGLARIAPEIMTPYPMQLWADRVVLPEGPCLAVIEDVTGAGKTEAALTLASRMMAVGKGEGIYFALPTEATANAMFTRLEAAHRRLFDDAASPSFVLAHGHSSINEPFLRIRQAEPGTTAAQCNAWIADHRRKAFFAHVGAGTIDQALLSILQKRYLTLRQYGLAGRILIIDEAHAYDAYMEELLGRLLQLHALSGGSAIILSATLPLGKREEFLRIYHPQARSESADFPLATLSSRDELIEDPQEAAPRSRRRVEIRRLTSRADMHDAASRAARDGASVLVMRNSVDEAIASTLALRGMGLTVDLFHARFAQYDRKTVEDDVVRRFGRSGTATDRARRVLVATQVVEQSIDVDFDVIFTDLAPVDLIVQRAGRLWRHERGTRPASCPVLHVLSPEPSEDVAEDWLVEMLGNSAYVYQNAAVMWRSAKVLFDLGQIETPDGLRVLIESVYGDAAPRIPDGLIEAGHRATGEEGGAKAIGRLNTVRLEDGYGVLGDLPKDQEIGTRLGEETRILRLARVEDGRVQPWAAGRQPWPRSEIRVRATWLAGARPDSGVAKLVEAARADWPDWDDSVIGVVAADGRLMLSDLRKPLFYTPSFGLTREAHA